ncbi:MAG: hypothetical protein ACJ76P_12040 [Actinomycetota bacterium]
MRRVLNSLIEMFGVSFGTLTIHASAGAMTRVEVNQSARPDEITNLLGGRP